MAKPPSTEVSQPAAPKKRGGCLRLLFWFCLIDALLLWGVGEHYFNLGSNLYLAAYRDSSAPLEIQTRRGWRSVAEITVAELGEALEERESQDGLRWCSLPLRRRPAGWFQQITDTLCGAEMNIITISPKRFEFVTSYLPKFVGTTAKERLANDELDFSITANFRDPQGRPLGWVYHRGELVNRPFPVWTGVFFVKNGLPYFGPKSLVEEIDGAIMEGTQGYPSVMKNHTIFSYVDLAPDKYFDGRRITYRALAGTRRDGTAVFVLSGDGGVCTVGEVTELAHKLEVQHATLLDGGRAMQYSLRTAYGPWHFNAFNTEADIGPRWMRPQKSPVYIGVRRRP